jgi:hypothetical protein
MTWTLQVQFIGSKCSAASYANTVVGNSVIDHTLPEATQNLYRHCFDDFGDFQPHRMVNANIKIRDPLNWKDEKGFPNFSHFVDWLLKGPVFLAATKNIAAGEEIICNYSIFLPSHDNDQQASNASSSEEEEEEEEEDQSQQQQVQEHCTQEFYPSEDLPLTPIVQRREDDATYSATLSESDTDNIHSRNKVFTTDDYRASVDNAASCAHRVHCTSQGHTTYIYRTKT